MVPTRRGETEAWRWLEERTERADGPQGRTLGTAEPPHQVAAEGFELPDLVAVASSLVPCARVGTPVPPRTVPVRLSSRLALTVRHESIAHGNPARDRTEFRKWCGRSALAGNCIGLSPVWPRPCDH